MSVKTSVALVRVPAWRATCECGWRGKLYLRRDDARERAETEAEKHRRAHEDVASRFEDKPS